VASKLPGVCLCVANRWRSGQTHARSSAWLPGQRQERMFAVARAAGGQRALGRTCGLAWATFSPAHASGRQQESPTAAALGRRGSPLDVKVLRRRALLRALAATVLLTAAIFLLWPRRPRLRNLRTRCGLQVDPGNHRQGYHLPTLNPRPSHLHTLARRTTTRRGRRFSRCGRPRAAGPTTRGQGMAERLPPRRRGQQAAGSFESYRERHEC
jgi:hypothetical protein